MDDEPWDERSLKCPDCGNESLVIEKSPKKLETWCQECEFTKTENTDVR